MKKTTILSALFLSMVLLFFACARSNADTDNSSLTSNSTTYTHLNPGTDDPDIPSDPTTDNKPVVSLQSAYDNATKEFKEDPEKHRNIGDLQSETQEIITIDGKYYQSYVSRNVDLRYVFISQAEYEMSADWDWLPIGTSNVYSLELIGKIDEGRK